MNLLLRLSASTLGAVVLLVAAWLAAHSCGLGVPELGLADLRALLAENRRGAALAHRSEALLSSCSAKRRVAQDLVEKRLTLSQAVAAFRQVEEARSEDVGQRPLRTGAAAEDGAVARSVLAWARAELEDLPAELRCAVLRRLEREFTEAFHEPFPYAAEALAE
jgi:hypothetical protein